MKMLRKKPIVGCLLSIFVATLGSCSSTGGNGGDLFTTTEPSRISASWTGGATGEPNDRTDLEPPPSEIPGRCPANAVEMNFNSVDCVGDAFSGLQVINNCTIPITLFLCATKGSLLQPDDQLEECADDPLATPLSRLLSITLNPGCVGDFINASAPLFVNTFFCSPDENLTTSPLECVGL